MGRATNLLMMYTGTRLSSAISLAAKAEMHADPRITSKYRMVDGEINRNYCR